MAILWIFRGTGLQDIHDIYIEPKDAQVLRAMGIRPDAQLELCRLGEPCIVCVQGPGGSSCRIGLARRLAERVLVSPGA